MSVILTDDQAAALTDALGNIDMRMLSLSNCLGAFAERASRPLLVSIPPIEESVDLVTTWFELRSSGRFRPFDPTPEAEGLEE